MCRNNETAKSSASAWMGRLVILASTAAFSAQILAGGDTAAQTFPSLEDVANAARSEFRKGGTSTIGASSAVSNAPAVGGQPAGPATGASRPTPSASVSDQSARLAELLNRYGVKQPLPMSVLKGKLYVAVSFSMPEPTLKRLFEQATAAGAGVILKGFVGTPVDTRARIVQVATGDREVLSRPSRDRPNSQILPPSFHGLSVKVAPKLYDRFEIREVPTFVLVSPAGAHDDCTSSSCNAYKEFITVSGDVSIPYALESIARIRPAAKSSAEFFARRAAAAARAMP